MKIDSIIVKMKQTRSYLYERFKCYGECQKKNNIKIESKVFCTLIWYLHEVEVVIETIYSYD